MEGIIRMEYRSDLNRVHAGKREELFLDSNADRVIQKCLNVLLDGVLTGDEQETVSICACFADSSVLDKVVEEHPHSWLSVLVFPKSERVSYKLNPRERFMSNAHQNPEIVIVQEIETGIHLHPTRTEDDLWTSGREYNRHYFPNRIKGALLFRENPLSNLAKYDWFKCYLDLNSGKV